MSSLAEDSTNHLKKLTAGKPSVTTELTLKWLRLSGDKDSDTHWREFCELREYLEREGLFA